jgi:hypothetical protein
MAYLVLRIFPISSPQSQPYFGVERVLDEKMASSSPFDEFHD